VYRYCKTNIVRHAETSELQYEATFESPETCQDRLRISTETCLSLILLMSQPETP